MPAENLKIFFSDRMKKAAQIFLCYAHQDAAQVEPLYEKLSCAGFQPFMDTKNILPGEDWELVLMNAIREAPFFLACLSKNSVNRRGMVQKEIREALEVWRQKLDSDIYFIPVRLEGCMVPPALAKFQWGDLFQDDGFDRLKLAVNTGLERLGVIRPIRLRSVPLNDLSNEEVKLMLQRNDFFDRDWYWMGKGLRHQYEVAASGKIVIDHTTGLTWQQSGSPYKSTYTDAEQYIRDELNNPKFAGYNDWRLPTLEEAMSLMEPVRKNGDLYIDPIFDQQQHNIWTVDKVAGEPGWNVLFFHGYCIISVAGAISCVRGVRSEPAIS